MLFRPVPDDGTLIEVHLTWSVESGPDWPDATTYTSADEFRDAARRENSD